MILRFHLSDCVWHSEQRQFRSCYGIRWTVPGPDLGRPHEITFDIERRRLPANRFIGRYLDDGTPVYMTPESIDIVHRH
jgi:hypothetical protein